jgi:hypothetical protein
MNILQKLSVYFPAWNFQMLYLVSKQGNALVEESGQMECSWQN